MFHPRWCLEAQRKGMVIIMGKSVLLVENDKRIMTYLSFAIGRAGYQIIRADDGLMGVDMAMKQKPDLILMDLSGTRPDNFETYTKMQEAGISTPILMLLSDQYEDLPEVDGGYLKKPFAMQELLMQIKLCILNTNSILFDEANRNNRTEFGRIVIDHEQVLVTLDNTPLDLTQREYDLICFMAKEPGRVFSREELLTAVWDFTYFGDVRIVDVTVRRLREKIEDDPAHPSVIVTRRGYGYVFVG